MPTFQSKGTVRNFSYLKLTQNRLWVYYFSRCKFLPTYLMKMHNITLENWQGCWKTSIYSDICRFYCIFHPAFLLFHIFLFPRFQSPSISFLYRTVDELAHLLKPAPRYCKLYCRRIGQQADWSGWWVVGGHSAMVHVCSCSVDLTCGSWLPLK